MPAAEQNHFTYSQIYRELEARWRAAKRSRGEGWIESARRVASAIAHNLHEVIDVPRNTMEERIDQARLVIFEYDLPVECYTYLFTQYLNRLYMKLFNTDSPDDLRILVVADEAHRINSVDYKQHTLDQLFREVREKGIGLVPITQSPSEMNRALWANTSSVLIGKLISSDDINLAARAIAFERPRERGYLARLVTGEFIPTRDSTGSSGWWSR
jgi:hypothetical protein